jgi:hypothetical protein
MPRPSLATLVGATAAASALLSIGAAGHVAGVGDPARPTTSAFPSTLLRGAGVYFPPNGKFYVMGGRTADVVGTDLTHPYEYDRFTDTWTQKSATFPDNSVDNMACAAMTIVYGHVIVCVGGSPAGLLSVTGRVLVYDPIGDSIVTLDDDPWPSVQSRNVLPGGFAVVGNLLFIIGEMVIR